MIAGVKVFLAKPLVTGALWFTAGAMSVLTIQRASKTVSKYKADAKEKADKEAAAKADKEAAAKAEPKVA